jgi:AAA domain
LTGASHTGKTTVANGVLTAVHPPAAFLSVDEVLQRTLRRTADEIWSNIPLAYQLIGAELGTLLDHGWFVIVESTFTYVPTQGNGEFHSEALEMLLSEAGSRDAPALITQLAASEKVVLERARQTGRLDPSIVSATIALHNSATFPLSPQLIDTTDFDAREFVARILGRLAGEPSSPAN